MEIRTGRVMSGVAIRVTALCSSLLPALSWGYVENVAVRPAAPHSNEVVTIVVSGSLPNPCWSIVDSTVTFENDRFLVEVVADEGDDLLCPDVLAPYEIDVPLGILDAGDYAAEVVDPQDSLFFDFVVTLAEDPDPGVDAAPFRRGDVNGDGGLELTDAVTLLNALFVAPGGIGCEDAADANDDGALEIGDAVFLLGFLFTGGLEFAAPGPRECGSDPTEDELGCAASPACEEMDTEETQELEIFRNGIVCVTFPCHVWTAVLPTGEERDFSDLDVSTLGLSPEAEEQLLASLQEGSMLVRGHFVPGPEGPAGIGTTLVVTALIGDAD